MPLVTKGVWVVGLVVLFGAVGAGIAYRSARRTTVPAKTSATAVTMSQAAESPEAEFAASVVGEISQLDGAINRAEWRKRHPNDESLQDHKSYTCPSFKGTEVLRSGRELTRTAYFAPPISAPEDLALPESIGDALIDSSCTLAMIRVETIEDGLEVGRTLVQAVQKEVSKKYDNRKTLPRHQN